MLSGLWKKIEFLDGALSQISAVYLIKDFVLKDWFKLAIDRRFQFLLIQLMEPVLNL